MQGDTNGGHARPDRSADQPIFWEPSLAFLKYAIAFILAGSAAYLVAVFVIAPEQAWRWLSPLSTTLVAAAAWFLLWRGRLEASVYVLAFGSWAAVTAIAAFTGGLYAGAILIYPLIIFMAGWLIGTRAAVTIALMTLAVTLGFALAASWDLLPPPPPTPPAMRWIVQCVVFALSVVLIVFAVRSYRSRLEEVRRLGDDLARRTAELQLSQDILHRAQALAQIGSWMYDHAADTMSMSAESCRIFGVPEGTVESCHAWLARVHPEDRDAVDRAWQATLRGEQTFDSEHRIVAGGAIRWVRQQAQLELGADGTPLRSVGTTQDITERKLAQEALRESEQRFYHVLQNVPSVAVQGYGMDQTTRYWNDASARLYGYTAQEAIGRSLLDLIIPPEMRSGVQAAIAEMSRTGEPIPAAELSLMRKDGSRVAVYSSHAVVRAPGGEPELFCIDVDLSELKRREAEILATQSQLAATLDAIPDLLFEVGLDGRFHSYHSPRSEFLYAAPRDFLGRKFSEVLPPDAAEVGMSALREAHEKGYSQGQQYALQLPQGKLWFELSVSRKPVGPGQEPRFIFLSRDVTERKRLEEALRAQTERLLIGQRAAHMVIMDWDIAKDELSWSDSPEWLRGPLPKGGKYPLYVDQVHPEDRDHFRALRAEAIDTLHSQGDEYRIVRTDGQVLWIRSQRIVLPGADGAAARMLIALQDVTERKLAEAEHARLEAQLREAQKMEALGVLAGGVAHNFNNIVAAIMGNVELASMDVGPGHAAQESLDEILKACRRAKNVVQQILIFTRRDPQARESVTLAAIVLESEQRLRASLPEGVELKVECAADAPEVTVNATQLRQVLTNLCSNAVLAIQDRAQPGLIEIRLEAYDHASGETPHPDATHAGRDFRPGRYACLTVRDNGIGMDAATRLRVFEPFFTTRPLGDGTGLGLSVVHGIVKAHGASIFVHSAPGEGATFRILFPAVDAPAAAAREPKETLNIQTSPASPGETPVPESSGKHILYVDDDEAIVILMTRLLERQGYRVSGYIDAREALAAVRAAPDRFDLAVTDYSMPGMSGLDLARLLRDIRADLPVAIATGYVTDELRTMGRAAGVRELIYKPNSVQELCAAVARLAQKSRS